MGLFNSYLKEGPGIEPDAPKKRGLALFFDIFFRKFFLIIKANMLHFIVSLPLFLILLLFVAPAYTEIFWNLEGAESELKVIIYMFVAGVLFNFVGSGPASAAYSYVTRCFTRSVPVWVGSDGFDSFRDNFKQSILLIVIDVAVVWIMGFAIRFYSQGTSFLHMYLMFLLLVLMVVYMISHTFAYQLMVTYENKLKDIVKNAIILTFAKLPLCLVLGVLGVVVCFYIFMGFGLFGIIVYAVIGMSLTKFPLEFYAARVIEKNIEEQSKN